MAVDLIIPVPNVDAIIGTAVNKYDSIKLYSATSRGGTYTLETTITLVAGDTTYSYTDSDGLSTTWYKVTYYNSVVPAESPIGEAEPFPAKRGTTSRKTLRQRIIRNFGGEVATITALAAQSATAASLTDTARDADWYTGWHMYRGAASDSADYDRRVSAYTNTSGLFTHGGAAYADTTVGTEELELMPVDINFVDLNNKIGEGLERARYLYRYEFGAAASTRQYDLPWFVEGPEYVVEAWLRSGTTANNWTWRPFNEFNRWWRVRGTAFQCSIDINPALADNDVIGLDIWRPGERLDSETDFTMVHESWAEAAAMVSVLDFLYNRDMTRHGSSNYEKQLGRWTGVLQGRARAYGPTGGMKLQVPAPAIGFPEV